MVGPPTESRDSFLEAYSSTTHVNSLEINKKLPERPSDTDLRTIEFDYGHVFKSTESLAPRKNLAELQTWLVDAIIEAETPRIGDPGGQIKLVLINFNRSFRASNADIDYCVGTMLGTLRIPSDAFTRDDLVKSYLFPPSLDLLYNSLTNLDDDITARSIACNTAGVAWKYYPRNLVTIGIVWALDDEGRGEVESILHHLSRSQSMLYHPLLLSVFTLQSMTTSMRNWVKNQKQQIEGVQIASGFHNYAGFESGRAFLSIDYSKLTAEVIGKSANIKTSELCLRGLHELATSIFEQNATFAKSKKDSGLSNLKIVSDFIEKHTAFWADESDAMIRETVAWQSKASMVVQGLFNLIAQRDQQMSIAIAQDSKNLAEQGQNIAHETRMLAKETKRDSTTMKAIAVVTIVFLPGTFVSSLLSMPIFELDPLSHRIVAHQFWLFWAITVPLTLATIVAWLTWDRISNKRGDTPWSIIKLPKRRETTEKD